MLNLRCTKLHKSDALLGKMVSSFHVKGDLQTGDLQTIYPALKKSRDKQIRTLDCRV
jgi:hypothetical protein